MSDRNRPLVLPRGFARRGFIDALIRLHVRPASGTAEAPYPPALLDRFREADCWPSRDLAVLWDLIDKLMLAAELDRPVFEEVAILDLACGRCSEALLLAAYASCFMESWGPGGIQLHGIDVREQELAKARERCAATRAFFDREVPVPHPGASFAFIHGDASTLQDYPSLLAEADWVFLRHQNGWHGMKLWTEIFNQGLSRLKPGGLLFITSYFDREHAMALNMISGLGGQLLASLRNPYSRALKTPGKSIDRHAAVFTRPE